MGILIRVLRFYFIAFLFNGANGFQTQRTSYMYGFTFSNYSYLNLSSIHEAQAPKTSKVLNFSHNIIEKITRRDFEGFVALEVLDLSYNQIQDIEPGSFENLLSLVSVNLSFNDQLHRIPYLAPHLTFLQTGGTSGIPQHNIYFERSSEAALESFVSAEEQQYPEGLYGLVNGHSKFSRTVRDLQEVDENRTVLLSPPLRHKICGKPINGVLDLSKSNLSEEELTEKMDASHCKDHLDSVVELNISHNNLEIDLLSLFILLLPMENAQSIDASYNKITISNIELGKICDFPIHRLLFVNISNNPLNSLDTVCLPSTIKIIDLSYTNINHIPKNFHEKLFNLERIYVQGNQFIYTVNSDDSGKNVSEPKPGTVRIATLSFVNTREGTPIESLPENVKYLKMSNCSIVELPEWFARTMKRLLFLDLSNNPISKLPDLPSSLQHLDLSNSDIKIIPPSFKSLSNLTVFKIQSNKITDFSPEYFLLTLTEYDVSKNKLKVLNLNENLRKAEFLNISGNVITQIDTTSPLSALTNVDGSHNSISELPDHFAKFLPVLKYFNLSGNKISFLQPGSLPESLVELDISNNAITTIVEETFGHLTKLNVLTVQGKHFFCNCDLYWFVNTYIHSPQLLINGRENLRCSFPPDKRGALVEKSNLTLVHCSFGIQMAITACAAILIMSVITSLCWHFDGPWYIRMGWYWCMAKRRQYEKRPENKTYDAFISYSENDASWTKENLLEKLETKGFKICYHERDFKPGHPVLGNIFYCIENSHKVLFVLSPSFVNSCWCQYELYFAEHRVLNENQDSLIMVVLEDLPPNSVPQKFSKLRKLLKRKTYLKWSPEEQKQKIFWHQLTAVLKTSNDPIVLKAENGLNQDTYEMECH
ncbi:PREDICTED: toll-like receptor 2 [Gavialis gangeticus]|uniref:toll-like receptor 2 n=1 Tax=Gavialis gangeticus TaxID=94835 RepID=UPI00092EA682|nr:PREDICTED: toll-like receptor 2 [Gavialis gangeticus]